MHSEQLVTMANQISHFFRYQSEKDEAVQNVARHLRLFWAPSMRTALVAWADDSDGDGMDPLVRSAVDRYRDELTQPGGHVPGEQQLAHPKGGGDAG